MQRERNYEEEKAEFKKQSLQPAGFSLIYTQEIKANNQSHPQETLQTNKHLTDLKTFPRTVI